MYGNAFRELGISLLTKISQCLEALVPEKMSPFLKKMSFWLSSPDTPV